MTVRSAPRRPFGLSLAIIASVMLFTVWPLVQFLVLWRIRSRIAEVEFEGNLQPLAVGGNILSVGDDMLALQTIFGLAFLGVALLAWRGRPPVIRYIVLASVLFLTLLTLGSSFLPLVAPQSLADGIDSGAAFRNTVLCGQLAVGLFVPLYTVWYMNRAPARAFFRGHYLTRPKDVEPGPHLSGKPSEQRR